VDDHSEDRTAVLAREAGAKVIPAKPLPEGWLGKPWACWQGAQAASGGILVFLDADTCLEPGGLERILTSYRRDGGLLSVWPFHRMVRLHERLSALFNVIILASMRCFTIWGRRLAPLGAFGPCVVCTRRDYFAAGGHEKVRGAIVDDVALGRVFRQAGHEIHNFGGRGSISFRMYPAGLGSLVDGFGKNLASGARKASPGVLVPLIGWIAGGFIVSFWLGYGLATGALTTPAGSGSVAPWPRVLPWGALYLLYALQIFWMLRRVGNYGPYTAVLFPLPLLFFAAVFFVSLLRTFMLHQVPWKGREIKTGGQ
jgi:4,4'-diaponeurosporenoate glycosyltransferase